jgi:hypothetical protein
MFQNNLVYFIRQIITRKRGKQRMMCGSGD